MSEHNIKLVMVDGFQGWSLWRCQWCEKEIKIASTAHRETSAKEFFDNEHGGECPGRRP